LELGSENEAHCYTTEHIIEGNIMREDKERTISEFVREKKNAEVAIAEILSGFAHKYACEIDVLVISDAVFEYKQFGDTSYAYRAEIRAIFN
jgi:hypothetical protein